MKNRYLFQKAEEELEKGINETFELLDNNGNGFLEPSQLKAAMKVLGFDPSPEQLGKIIGTVDRSGKGVIRRDDFLRVMTARFVRIASVTQYDSDPKEQLRDGFDNIMDADQLCVTLGSLTKVASDMGESLSEAALQQILAECDKDGDGMLSFEQFLRVVRKTTPAGS